jgi:dipeptidyl aminopeptidase/acylaminoacyl peptidase
MRILLMSLTFIFLSPLSHANESNQSKVDPSTIPVEAFFKRAQFEDLVISPDGKHIAATYAQGTSSSLAIMDIGLTKILSNFNFGEFRRIGEVYWPRNDRILFSYIKFVGYLDENGDPPVYVAYDLDGKNGRQITNPTGANYEIISLLPKKPNKILVTKANYGDFKDRQGDFSQIPVKLFEIDIEKGKEDYLATEPPGVNQIVTDTKGNPRFAFGYNEDRNDEMGRGTFVAYIKRTAESSWEKFDSPKFTRQDGSVADVRLLGAAEDGSIYFSTNYKSSLPAIYTYSTETQKFEHVHTMQKVDIGNSLINHKGALEGFRISPDYNRMLFLSDDAIMKKIMEQLFVSFGLTQEEATINITSITKDGNKVIFNVNSDRDPGTFYLFNRGLDGSKPSISQLAVAKAEINPALMADIVPFEFKARDGVPLSGYYALPTVGKGPFPMVQIIHGGPHGPRDFWGWNREAQFLVSRGYSVVFVNFRGSGGYGIDFEESGYQEWGGKMIDDMTDATMWMVNQGYADKDRLCVYGGSYGGYGTLQSLVREPDLYKCGIGYVGVYSLFEMKNSGDIPKRRSGKRFLDRVLSTDETLMRKFSPAYNVDKIKADLFIAHGREDVRVPMEQYDVLSKNLKRVGKSYKSMIRDEGHGYQQIENVVDFYTAMEKFFDKNLKN